MNTGDTAFVLMSAALVMLMTPGLALFYGGMVQGKNVLGMLMQSFIILGIITLEWVLWGVFTFVRSGPCRYYWRSGMVWAKRGGCEPKS